MCYFKLFGTYDYHFSVGTFPLISHRNCMTLIRMSEMAFLLFPFGVQPTRSYVNRYAINANYSLTWLSNFLLIIVCSKSKHPTLLL